MTDELNAGLADLLDGTYDCVDRIVLNGYHSVCYSAGGFRLWWRSLMGGSEEQLDNAHLMRLAGRFSRRVRGFAKAHNIPVIDCRRGDRKHDIAEDYLAEHSVGRGLFMILVGRAVAPVWDVQRSSGGGIHLTKKLPYVNHYSFHIMDAQWGHITIKMAGHPPFGTQIILNGHEYVACQANKRHLTFTKEDNCFTQIADAADLARIADTLSEARTVGRLVQVCERWIYSACLCFALGIGEQERTGFRYAYSVYQVEYSRNLLFHLGSQLEQVFQPLHGQGPVNNRTACRRLHSAPGRLRPEETPCQELDHQIGSLTPVPTLAAQPARGHRPPGSARARHWATPRRRSHTTVPLQASNVDARRPALSTASPRHAAPLSRTRYRSIDNRIVDPSAQAPNGVVLEGCARVSAR